jgi:hypothetical protein
MAKRAPSASPLAGRNFMVAAGRRALGVSAALAAALALQAPVAEAAETEPIAKLEGPGTVSPSAPLEMRFRLPAGARQGHGTWYLARLAASVQAKRTGRHGVATLIADIDGLATNLIEVRVRPDGKNCPQVIGWATVDLLKGSRHHSKCDYRASFVSSNFPQIRAIQPGLRRLRVSIDDPQDVIEKVELQPGSGVYLTNAGPAKLRIEVRDDGSGFPPDEWSKVEFSIENIGQRPARGTRVRVEAESSLEVKRKSIAFRPLIRPGDSVDTAAWVRPRGMGPERLGIIAEGRTARAATEVVVKPSSTMEESTLSIGRISFLVALGGVGLLFFGAFTQNRRPARA